MTAPPEKTLVRVGLLIVGMHLLDTISWRPAIVLAVVAVLLFRLPATVRAAFEAVLAAGATAAAAFHVIHWRWDGLGRTDVTGIACSAAALFFAVAAVRALLSRRALTPWRRVGRALLALGGAVLLILFAVVPLAAAMWISGKPRRPLAPATFPLAHTDVAFRAQDGTRLAGWWVPSRNGAAVVLVHGGGGDRNGVRRQALLLARHGYGVLLYDERGRGRSGGTTQSMGWNWTQDVSAAVDYVLRQPKTRAVGLLGLSTGAEVVVTEAAHDPRVKAIVAESMINRDLADSAHQRMSDNITGLPYWLITFIALRVETGTRPPEPLTTDLRLVAPRPLLIIAAAQNAPERVVAPVWAHAGGPTARLWLAPTSHTHALESFPRAYERRVVGLFDRGLLP